MFEIRERDAAGRNGIWSFGTHKVNTPQIAVVVNPNKLAVPPSDLKKDFGAEIIITNAYIIKKSTHFQKILSLGIHKFFGWAGPIYTDSGTYQMHSQGGAEILPEETLKLQEGIGSDIITPLDVFTEPKDSRDVAMKNVNETKLRVNMARELVNSKQLVGPIQGGAYIDLRKRAAESIATANPDVFAIGGIVPLMEQYRFKELAETIIACKKSLPSNVPVHAFGAGHPMIFSLLAACGVDLFDSAAYSLYAEGGRYMTPQGTLKIGDLERLPCECPVCSSHTPRELDVNLLARHNLYVTFAEIRAIQQAICEGRLWDLVRVRAYAHPALFSAYEYLLTEHRFFGVKEPLTKKSQFFYFGRNDLLRPDIRRAITRSQKIESAKKFTWYGKQVPLGLSGVFPFSSSMPDTGQGKAFSSAKPKELLAATLAYQYGRGAEKIMKKGVRIEISRSTGRIRRAFIGKDLLGTIRASDGFFVPTIFGAKRITSVVGHGHSVVVSPDALEFVRDGKSVFSKFVVSAGSKILPGDEVFVVGKGKEVVACGTALLNADEMIEFRRGVAVDVRHA